MASKYGIAAGGGVIDADYTGEVKLVLRTHGNTSYQFKAGDHIAQVIVKEIQHTMRGKSITLKTRKGELGDKAPATWVPNS